jgi:hypothetical protein
MNNEINMHYRFISDDEPSEEQLAFLMQDVGKEIIKQKSNLQSIVLKNILLEYQNAKKLFPNL